MRRGPGRALALSALGLSLAVSMRLAKGKSSDPTNSAQGRSLLPVASCAHSLTD